MKIVRENEKFLDNIKNIHLIGIGGSGMCPLAEILHSKGYTVTGSDNNIGDPLMRLKKLGLKITLGHDAKNVDGAQLVVYSAAISADNPEIIAAKTQKIPLMERSELFGAITRKFDKVIGVCGTHGKTTVTSMLTQILYLNDYDPTAVIGGMLPAIGANGRAGNSEYMVCEACEYVDTFLHLSPDYTVLLNIDNDHLEYFKTMENLTASFAKFVGMGNTAFINGDDRLCKKAVENYNGNVITFGINPQNDFFAKDITPGKRGMAFTVCNRSQDLVQIKLNIPGNHNVLNALAAFSAAYTMGLSPEQIKSALESFTGAGRRFEFLCEKDGITFADDYAHHPTEIEATVKAAKSLDYNNVIVVFQPFTFSRTAMLKNDFIKALSFSDKVIITPIMGSREKNTYGIYSEQLVEELPNAMYAADFAAAEKLIFETAKSGDLVITMGGGDIYKVSHVIRDK